MSRNGSGTYTLPAGNPVVTNTVISSTWANTTLTDLANAMTGSVAADGQTPMTGPLNLNSNKIANVTDPTLDQDATTKAYVDAKTNGTLDGSFTNLAYTGTLTGGTGVVNLGSGQFYKDASGNVGIGTATPTKKLEVAGSIMVTQDYAATTGAVVLRQNSGNTVPAYLQWVNNTNTAQKGFITVSTSNVMQFGNSSGAVTMSLDDIGRRTNPNQISFRATYSGADWSSTGTPIIFNSAIPNVGSGYNGTNGIFTAPVSGTYIFYCLALSTLSTVLEIGFWANSSFVVSGRNTGSAYASSAYCTITIPLTAGDSVWCGIQGGTVYGSGFNQFGGYLLG